VKITGEVEGSEQTQAAFNELADKVKNDAPAASQVAAIVAGKAGSFAPIRTGLLASSFGVQDRYIVNSAPYSGYVEYGVPSLGMAPMYMVQQAFDVSVAEIDNAYSQWIASEAKSSGFEAQSG
jgi:hypothetical protein